MAGRSGRSSAWLERVVWDHEVAGSNPVAPTLFSEPSLPRLHVYHFRSSGAVQTSRTGSGGEGLIDVQESMAGRFFCPVIAIHSLAFPLTSGKPARRMVNVCSSS